PAVVAGSIVGLVVAVVIADVVALVLVLARDLGPVVDDPGDRLTLEHVDRQLARRRVERGDRARVLIAVHDPVVVAVAITRVGSGPELVAVVEPVAVLVATGLLHLQGEVVVLLPLVRDPVPVAVLGCGGPGKRDQQRPKGGSGDRDQPESM